MLMSATTAGQLIVGRSARDELWLLALQWKQMAAIIKKRPMRGTMQRRTLGRPAWPTSIVLTHVTMKLVTVTTVPMAKVFAKPTREKSRGE
jgi:hypothetical protein